MTQGNKGLLIRYVLFKSISEKCGDNVSIHPQVYIFNARELSVGDNVSIHPMCYIDATGRIQIGSDVSIAHGTTIMSTNHQYSDVNLPIKDQPIDLINTQIDDDVWVGAKVTILAGIKVESGSVLAAGAVITKDVSKHTIVGGVPAIEIKNRGV
ncbi:galactoside O-acetyltransferase [Sporosarcina sp. P16b]|nr:galactoside O-acetyltransferase [Sporosarcina sp. P16b]